MTQKKKKHPVAVVHFTVLSLHMEDSLYASPFHPRGVEPRRFQQNANTEAGHRIPRPCSKEQRYWNWEVTSGAALFEGKRNAMHTFEGKGQRNRRQRRGAVMVKCILILFHSQITLWEGP